ncbi:PREDICTED: flavin-containing monooxygenase FMO GS-OX-like 2 [Rhagoletis zephyria]|uniref:flavin-containing monooxygenase FMO GS-OX-like 2 n=1 Tax=Rhagoletis zephyria TaxID=28612 RepID=UPI0008118163|nr:PREDICTED: flavin-containing monooxygenase FMO GS-OX-like 2 [Rhagoletis zephyria]
MPSIDSIDQFTGTAIHSHYYRHREPFTGQKVAIIGAGPSGLDICGEVATVAEQVILLNRRTPFKGMPANVQQINGEVLAFKDKSIAISIDGNAPVEFSIDSVIFATGYLFNLPYLDIAPEGAATELPDAELLLLLPEVLELPLVDEPLVDEPLLDEPLDEGLAEAELPEDSFEEEEEDDESGLLLYRLEADPDLEDFDFDLLADLLPEE